MLGTNNDSQELTLELSDLSSIKILAITPKLQNYDEG